MAIVTGLTIEEFEQLPDRLAHNHELIKGELVDVSGNIGNHNRLRDLLVRLMGSYVDEHKLGYIISEQEYDFDGDAYGPDISFFGPEKLKLYDGQLRVQRFVPDLVVEIASRGERFETLMEKIRIYPSCGVKEAFIFSILTRQAFRYSEQPPVILTESQEFRPEQIP